MTTLVLRSVLMKLMITTNIFFHVALSFTPNTTILCRAGKIDSPSYLTRFKNQTGGGIVRNGLKVGTSERMWSGL